MLQIWVENSADTVAGGCAVADSAAKAQTPESFNGLLSCSAAPLTLALPSRSICRTQGTHRSIAAGFEQAGQGPQLVHSPHAAAAAGPMRPV